MIHSVEIFAAGFSSAIAMRFLLAIPGAIREQRAMRETLARMVAEKQRAQPSAPVQPLRIAKPRA